MSQWLDAQQYSSMTFSSGTVVSTWSDKSNNGTTVTTNTGSPTYISIGSMGNKPCISFINSRMISSNFQNSENLTIALVLNLPNKPSTNWATFWGHFSPSRHDFDICVRVSSLVDSPFTANTALNLHTNNNNKRSSPNKSSC